LDYLTTHTSLSPIRCGFAPSFINYKKGCTRLSAASDKVYQLLAHGWWFSPGTPASSTTKTGCHDIAEILLKVALNTINQSIKYNTVISLLLTFLINKKKMDFHQIYCFWMHKLFNSINHVIDIGKYLMLSNNKRHYINNCIRYLKKQVL
jgi:hypothetical protein